MRNAVCFIVCLLLIVRTASAQSSYNNSWIDYNKTYYKFKVGLFGTDFEGWPVKKGVVRVAKSALVAAGLGNVPAEQLQLWRNGQEIPIYVSKPTGVLGAGDYVEFWGEAADGRADKDLYKFSAYQLSDYWGLETDSASYFFTVNTGVNKRFVATANSVSGAAIKPDKNFTYTIGKYYREQLNPGYGSIAGDFSLHLSSMDAGEGFSSYPSGGATSWQSPTLFADKASTQKMVARFNLAGTAQNNRSIKIALNGTELSTFSFDDFSNGVKQFTGINPALLANDSAQFYFYDITEAGDDNFVIGQIEMDYARKFNFGGQSSFEFTLAASDTGRYIKIGNFSSNGSIPVLYDIDNGKRYVANVAVTDTLRFLLNPSAKPYHLVLVRGDGSAATAITTIQKRQFTDYTKPANQGNYLIISNPLIYGSGSANYVQQYKDYRASQKGGSFKAQVVDITDLEDQFAFGIKMHPLAVKNFLRFARNNFSIQPAFAFLIGKGLEYTAYRQNETDAVVQQTGLVPTFGAPGSDNLLSSEDYDPIPATPIGRLSAVSPQEVGNYLAKIKQYEQAQQDESQTFASKAWMKNVLQLTGVNDEQLGIQLDKYMLNYKSIISDSAFGGNVTTFSKSAEPSQYPEEVANFTNIFNRGSSLVTYFGHSSSTDLDFSLDNPANYNNTGRYPVFIVNGCLAGNIFDYGAARLTNLSTISEKFVLQPQRGAIGYLSTSSFGVVGYLDEFTKQFYRSIATKQYGKGFGLVMQDAITSSLNVLGVSYFYARMHAEQYTFHGDPALKINSFGQPDFAVQASDVRVNPSFISVADDSFSVKVIVTNLGRATNQPVHFGFYRKLETGEKVLVFSKQFTSIKIADSVTITLPIVPNKDLGTINFIANIDDDYKVDELSDDNNIVQVPVTISAADIRPVFPYNYAIVNTATVTLAASTGNPLDTLKNYTIQVDTTSLFNSPKLASYQVNSTGGVIQKAINLPLDNTVYFWRVTQTNSGHWNNASFIHRSGGNEGFEQSHFYQHTQSFFTDMVADSATRKLKFAKSLVNLFVKQAIYPYSGSEDADFSVAVNGTFIAQSACVGNSVIFNVFDAQSFKVYANATEPYGAAPNCKAVTANNFEFYVGDASSRNKAMQFLDSFVHDGDYVVARSIDVPGELAAQWAADTSIYGHNNSLYHRFKQQGIDIDKYNSERSYIFVFKKNDSTHFAPVSVYSNGLYDAINTQRNISVFDTVGFVTSPKFGPAKAWTKVTWQGVDDDTSNIASLNIIGVDTTNIETVLYTIGKGQAVKNIAAVDAKKYPYIRLQMHTQDSIKAMPYQLKDWSVEYSPVAEGGLAPNIGAYLPDSINFENEVVNNGPDTLQGYVVFKNVSVVNFAALKVKLILYDSANVAHAFNVKNTKALVAGDTANVWFSINATALPAGKYNFYLGVNADKEQPEQYLFNNVLYKYLVITRKRTVPSHLLLFTAQSQGKGVMLNWKATNEINFAYYGVEFSTDSRQFSQIGQVPGLNGNIGDVKSYNYLHGTPVTGQNYYRLKMVDKDGKYSYSNIVKVGFGADEVIKVYPNPFTTSLKITVNSSAVAGNMVRVLDMAGKVVMQQSFAGNNLVLDVSRLAVGNYLVQVNDNVQMQSFKVQKQKN